MWDFFLNSVFSGCLKLLIVVLARSWAVVLTNCERAVVNSIRIKKWVVHSYKSQMGYIFSATHLWATKLTRPLKNRVDAYAMLCQLIVNTRF